MLKSPRPFPLTRLGSTLTLPHNHVTMRRFTKTCRGFRMHPIKEFRT